MSAFMRPHLPELLFIIALIILFYFILMEVVGSVHNLISYMVLLMVGIVSCKTHRRSK